MNTFRLMSAHNFKSISSRRSAHNFKFDILKTVEFWHFECRKDTFHAVPGNLGIFAIFDFSPIWAVQKVFGHTVARISSLKPPMWGSTVILSGRDCYSKLQGPSFRLTPKYKPKPQDISTYKRMQK